MTTPMQPEKGRERTLRAHFSNADDLNSREWLASEARHRTDDSLDEHRDLVRALTKHFVTGGENAAAGLSHLIDFSSQLALDTGYETLLDRIVEAASQLGIAERVLVVMRDGDTLRVVREYGQGGSRVPTQDIAHISETLVRQCLRHNEIDIRSNLASDPQFRSVRSIAQLDLHSSVCVPLRAEGNAIGVLYLDSRRHLQQSDLAIRLLVAFAGHASLCLSHTWAMSAARAVQRDLAIERDTMRDHLYSRWRRRLVGKSAPWRRIVEQIEMYQDHPHPILILGETGTGKDEVASALRDAAIHHRTGPLVRVNCTTIPDTLQEAELFGTVRGAFTNAQDRKGLVEQADGGTLFLNEVGDMAPTLQAKMLAFLESGHFYRVGDPAIRQVDVRIISATHRPLTEMVEAGTFREDLFYRLKGVRIDVPPLRQRVEDIPLLADHFLSQDAELRKLPVPKLTRAAERILTSYRWPGNVRELRRVIENAFTHATFEEESIEPRHIRDAIQENTPGLINSSDANNLPETLKDAVRQTERLVLVRALDRYNGDARLAALELGVTRQTLYNLRRRHLIAGRKETT